jgi:hypothetical protein
MKKYLQKTLLSAALAFALAPGFASANATWYVNYTDANAAGGLGITLGSPLSRLTDEYKYTAESLIEFSDNDASGGISAGDTFDDYIAFRIDNLFIGSNNTFDPDYQTNNVEISGRVIASGIQVDAQNYLVTSAAIEFYFDGPTTVGGTGADFGSLGTFVDGVLVQTGTGNGGGANAALVPDGAIDINFDLADTLSTLGPNFDPFELFDPFIDLDKIKFLTDSNNAACVESGGTGNCGSSIASLTAFFGADIAANGGPGDFRFITRSDGSAVKVPEPATIALLGMGLLGAGFARRKNRK